MSTRRLASPSRIQLDSRLRTPAYIQIADQIQRLVGTGRLQPGAQIPTVRELARRLGVNFNTVARAYRLLVDRDLLSTQPGRGSFVLQRLTAHHAQSVRLRALARDYIARSRALQFNDAQLTEAVQRELQPRSAAAPPGDNHE